MAYEGNKMRKIQLNIISLLITILSAACTDLTDNKQYNGWKIGAKIHFEEENGHDYIGLKEINAFTKDVLRSTLHIGHL